MWLLELAAGLALAQTPDAVVTFDNGGFNAALYAPRYTGFAKPSAAREIAASIGRVAGANPAVWTYLPPGRVAGRPGDPHRVMPRREACSGAADQPSDPCWCGPGDSCWGDLDVNRHPGGSTSLYLTAARLREGASGGRIEIHFTDLFEEDPSSAENPADSDKCVTRSGARRAVEGLLGPPGGSVDHLAIGLLRISIDPPPPGRDAGSTFTFREGEGGCWSGASTGRWASGRDPLDFGMGVVVLGIDTADQHEAVARFLDGLEAQLNSEKMALSLVRLREPPQSAEVDGAVEASELAEWGIPDPPRGASVPCEEVQTSASFTLDGQPLDGVAVSGDCSGAVQVAFQEGGLRSMWHRLHGLDPRAGDARVEGRVSIEAAPGAAIAALEALGGVNDAIADRPLPLWAVVNELARTDAGLRPFEREVAVSLEVAGLDARPWVVTLLMSMVFGLAGAAAATRALTRMQANRAYQAAWDRAVGADEDPLRQRPVAVVLAEAQEDVRRRWLGRWLGAVVLATSIFALSFFLLMRIALLGVIHG